MLTRYNEEVYSVLMNNHLHAICHTRKGTERLVKAMENKPIHKNVEFRIVCMNIIEYGEEE